MPKNLKVVALSKYLDAKNKVELLRDAVDTMSSYFLMWDHDDRLIVCNEKIFELYPNAQDIFIVGRTFEEIVRMGVERGDFEVPKGIVPEEWIKQRVILHKQGDYVEERPVKGRWLEIRDQKTACGYIASTSTDITHLKKQEEQLKKQARELKVAKEKAVQAESRLRDSLDTMSESFTLWDQEDRLVVWNEKIFELYPQAREFYVQGRAFEDIFNMCVEKGGFDIPAGISKEEWIQQRVTKHKNASYTNVREIKGRWLQVKDQHTKQGNIVTTAIDVTPLEEKKQQLEEALKQTKQALEQAQKARHEAELARAQAEQADKAKSDFLAMLSHEVRTPLHSVMTMGQLLLKSHLDVDQHRKVMTILRSTDGLWVTIDDLLEFSKLEAGKISSEETDFDLKAMIEGVMTLYHIPVQQKDLVFTYYIDPKLPRYFKGEAGKIRQILLNLVGNAVKFTSKGHIIIHVKEASTNPLKLSIEVEDTGIGLSSEEQKKIFDAFAQAHDGIAQQYGGAGLGLSICKKFAASMGGEVGVNSRPKKGSTFWVTCCIEPGDQVPEELPWQGFKTEFDMPEIQVLVVEDNKTNQQAMHEFFNHLDQKADIVASGPEALYQLTQKSYDLVIMDIQLPGMDGYETTRRIRTLPAPACSVPVIGLSAQSTKKNREMGEQAGMNAYLGKPMNMWCLYKAIADIKGYKAKDSLSKAYKEFSQLKDDQHDKAQLVAIDQTYLQQMLEALDQEEMQTLVTDYEHIIIKDYNQKFRHLMRKKNKNFEAIYRLMDDFKSAAGTFGLQRVVSVIDNISAGAEERDTAKIKRYYAKARDEIKIALPLLKGLFGDERTKQT